MNTLRILRTGLVYTAALALSASLAAPLNAAPDGAPNRPRIVFLVSSEQNSNSYESARTIPPFAETLASEHDSRTTVPEAEFPESESSFPDIETVWDAELLVIFCRRLGLPPRISSRSSRITSTPENPSSPSITPPWDIRQISTTIVSTSATSS